MDNYFKFIKYMKKNLRRNVQTGGYGEICNNPNLNISQLTQF
jgi:hypothetical protein